MAILTFLGIAKIVKAQEVPSKIAYVQGNVGENATLQVGLIPLTNRYIPFEREFSVIAAEVGVEGEFKLEITIDSCQFLWLFDLGNEYLMGLIIVRPGDTLRIDLSTGRRFYSAISNENHVYEKHLRLSDSLRCSIFDTITDYFRCESDRRITLFNMLFADLGDSLVSSSIDRIILSWINLEFASNVLRYLWRHNSIKALNNMSYNEDIYIYIDSNNFYPLLDLDLNTQHGIGDLYQQRYQRDRFTDLYYRRKMEAGLESDLSTDAIMLKINIAEHWDDWNVRDMLLYEEYFDQISRCRYLTKLFILDSLFQKSKLLFCDTILEARIAGLFEKRKRLFQTGLLQNIELRDNKNRKIRLYSRLDSLNLIYFWNTGCYPCIRAMPKLAKFLNENQHINFISIALQIDNKEWTKVLDRHDVRGTHLIDINGFRSEISQLLSINSVPRYVIVDESGRIVDGYAPENGAALKRAWNEANIMKQSRGN